jgi:hypothetical protein
MDKDTDTDIDRNTDLVAIAPCEFPDGNYDMQSFKSSYRRQNCSPKDVLAELE